MRRVFSARGGRPRRAPSQYVQLFEGLVNLGGVEALGRWAMRVVVAKQTRKQDAAEFHFSVVIGDESCEDRGLGTSAILPGL